MKYIQDELKDDIVIVKALDEYIIKRIVGVPGDQLKIDSTGVYINGEPVESIVENYRTNGTITLKSGEYFVMGDNRSDSTDSRDSRIGIINQDLMLGKVVLRMSNATCPVPEQ